MLADVVQAAIDRAEGHAERVSPGWAEQASEFLWLYSLKHREFTAEEVLAAAEGSVPTPPDGRAWGGVFRRAARNGSIVLAGYEATKNKKVHNHVIRRWKSANFWEP